MSTTHIDRLRALLEPLAAQAGLDLEDVKVTQAGNRRQVQIDVDADGGVDLDAIADFSRIVGEALDESEVMGAGAYVLEVGSPGAERPLVEPRHWRRAEGRLAAVHLVDGGEIVARVLEADEDGALVEVQPVKGAAGPRSAVWSTPRWPGRASRWSSTARTTSSWTRPRTSWTTTRRTTAPRRGRRWAVTTCTPTAP